MANKFLPSSSKLNEIFEDYRHLYETYEDFKAYLTHKGYSTVHAEEIFALVQKNSKDHLKLERNAVKFRGAHPKRDKFIKRGVIPAVITLAGIGGVIGAVAASSLIGGSTILGLIPISGTPGLTEFATTCVGAVAGVVGTTTVLGVNAALRKIYYSLRYKSAKANLKEFETGVDLESLPIKDLMDKIEKTSQKVLETKKHHNPFSFVRRHILNSVNLRRIRHLEKYTIDLAKQFRVLEQNKHNNNSEKLASVYKLLKQVDEFVAKDSFATRLHSLLTCKDSSKHTHKSWVENVHKYGTIQQYLNALSTASIKDTKKTISQVKKNVKNIKNVQTSAYGILNGDRLISKLVARYEETLTPETPKFIPHEEVVIPKIPDEEVIVTETPIVTPEVIPVEEVVIPEIPAEKVIIPETPIVTPETPVETPEVIIPETPVIEIIFPKIPDDDDLILEDDDTNFIPLEEIIAEESKEIVAEESEDVVEEVIEEPVVETEIGEEKTEESLLNKTRERIEEAKKETTNNITKAQLRKGFERRLVSILSASTGNEYLLDYLYCEFPDLTPEQVNDAIKAITRNQRPVTRNNKSFELIDAGIKYLLDNNVAYTVSL